MLPIQTRRLKIMFYVFLTANGKTELATTQAFSTYQKAEKYRLTINPNIPTKLVSDFKIPTKRLLVDQDTGDNVYNFLQNLGVSPYHEGPFYCCTIQEDDFDACVELIIEQGYVCRASMMGNPLTNGA